MKSKSIHIISTITQIIVSSSLIMSGLLKLIGVSDYVSMINELSTEYAQNIYLLGIIAIISGTLFLIPRTFIFGFISTLVFMGGTISAHMQHGDVYIAQIAFVIMIVFTARIKKSEWFGKSEIKLQEAS
jgi:hypothetical protein